MATQQAPVNNLHDAAFNRLSKAILRRRTLTLFTTAIEREVSGGTDELAKRSGRVLQYMRGYNEAVDTELALAQEAYDLEAYKSVRKARVSAARNRD